MDATTWKIIAIIVLIIALLVATAILDGEIITLISRLLD